ncbi:aminopeptidase N-like isoform X2 [Ruditapes philippinarum]|uniref:aminopeptidase N-like isoform X2 n=1 Tax=Ruditapes philippinarum TaxID=129788 RepID=UPI00295ADB98|nr:aminopeptidase N-like isoform X2 [Ruditapes philippinarum]
MSSKYELSNLSNSESTVVGEDKMSGKDGGCYVRTATGFLIALVAILISVGVGLIVHFAENRPLECSFPDTYVEGQSKTQQQQKDSQAVQCPQLTTNPANTQTPSASPSATSAIPMLKDVRLPKSMVPIHYDLRLQPEMYSADPTTFIFKGKVAIDMNCAEATKTVTLHINMLNITKDSIVFKLKSGSGSTPQYVKYTEDEERQFLIVHFDKDTTPGTQYTLSMDFVGPLKDDLQGFYLSSYKEGNNTVYLATTQFEPTDARKAFPCFDEPAMKATFKVTLVRKKHLMSLSNMPIVTSNPIENGYVEDRYNVTEKMSTYLLAFVIGQFNKTQGVTKNGLKYGAWARPESVSQTHVALDVGVNTIYNYEKYFDIPFPLPKQDMIALPDFRAGAMENWGLITYRESAMLFTGGVSSEMNRQRIVTIITHELGHQWFGDLVTMDWWDDIWLNEGFATFVEYLGADMIHPDWEMFEQFVINEVHQAMEFDSLVTSHPIYVPVDNPDEIHEIFDTISYAKGGSVIRMIRFVLGEETFKKGLTLYLKQHSYGNAKHDDLWNAWATQAHTDGHDVDVKKIMDTWTLQMNFPVVKVTKQNGKIHVEQSRFLKNKNARDPGKYHSPFDYKWEIPFTYLTSANPDFNITNSGITWLSDSSLEIAHVNVADDQWILGNVGQYGYYMVNYEDSNWKALIQQLRSKHTVISNINRAQIINDAWSLARAGQLSTDIALSVLEYLDKELDYVPWQAARKQLNYLDDMFRKTDLYGKFENFMLSKLSGPFSHFGTDDENATHIESLIRSDIVEMACSYGLKQCIQYAKQLFAKWMDSPDMNPIDPDLRPAVYCTAIAEGDATEWNFAFDKYKAATVATEKVTLSKALACTKSTWLLSRYLELSINPDVVRKQDATYVILYIGSNPIGQSLAWDFVRGRWDYLFNTYGKGVFSFARLISGITSTFNTEFQLKQLHDFLGENPNMGTGNRAFKQAIEKTQTNFDWMTKNREIVANWLDTVGKKHNARVTDVRLPVHLIPDTYDVTLQPNMYGDDPESFNFEGHVKIYMTAKEAGRNVTLHVNKLNINEESITFGKADGSPGGPAYKGQRESDKERQFEIFYLNSDIVAGQKYTIEMAFTGPLVGDLAGLYLSQYKRGNDTVYIATTQFEPTDARKAFPCFDEPQLKAKFNVKLARKSHMVSISNMPIISQQSVKNGFIVDTYNTSAIMSTYLLAFIVCDFKYTNSTTSNGVTYRAWARPESINQTAVALETGTKILSYYADYFGEAFPLPKQDMIAIPDFAAGAMENWGLITYRETAMLFEKGVSSEGNLQRVKVVVAHELAHQWFGDLVTMNWWDDLWLNEGFASFVEYMGTDHVSPDWKMFEQFVFEIYEVFDIDSLTSSHPIYVPVQNPDEINEIFDTISYAKGGSVIRMMRFFLGEDTFKLGLQEYLHARKYQNADHNDLWDALEQQAKKENKPIKVREVLDTWILQMNYPVVTISKDANEKVKIKQERFLKDKNAKDPGTYTSPFDYQWKIPFTMTTSTDAKFNQTDSDVAWLKGQERSLQRDYPTGPNSWIIGNIQQYGVYRVNYDDDNWNNLIHQLKTDHKAIHVLNRGQIINDAFGLAQAKMLSMDIALRTLEYLTEETEYVPWVAAGDQLGYIHKMIAETELYGAFERFMQATVSKQYNRLGLDNSGASHLESYVRSEIASHACGYDITNCTETAKKLLQQYMDHPDNNPIEPELKSTIYCTALREGGEKEWEFLFQKYMTATVQAEKSRLLSTLSCTRKTWILNKLLEYALDTSIVRKQDAYKVFIYVGRNIVGRAVAWDFFRSKWDDIFETYGTGSFSLSDIVSGVTASFNTEFKLQQLKDFQAAHPDMGSGSRAMAQTIENTNTNIQWMKDNYDTVKKWLENYKKA